MVDNNSSDGSVEMLRKKFPDVILIPNNENFGFSKANNTGIKSSRGEYVLLLNPDTLLEEDTLIKAVKFMDEHADAGGLGVKMIDGKGNFLPESKRGLPTPSVAFYKISGLSKLFPKSKIFGQYHLGYLDKNKAHSVDVLSGAFMLLRKSVLDKTGLLDENFFMYGEDIDLSYRIKQAGYKNYYYPQTRIIHYKGESTRKSSVNYVVVFYRAMVLFAKKHFGKSNAALFSFLINVAIAFRAVLAVLSRVLRKIFLPAADAVLFYAGMYVLKTYWESSVKLLNYPGEFMTIVVPAYILIWILSVFFNGGYDAPVRLSRIIRGLLAGTVMILVIYALLPESMRFSRALILLGTGWACLAAPSIRIVLNALKFKEAKLEGNQRKRVVIAGGKEEGSRVLSLLQMTDAQINFIGFIRPENGKPENTHDVFETGEISQLPDIIRVYDVDEVIFCARDLEAREIISQMLAMNIQSVEFKIAPPESMFIIGSSSMNERGDYYFVDVRSAGNVAGRRNKRLFDVTASLIMLLLFPVTILLSSGGVIKNIFRVLSGKRSWVGFEKSFPGIKKGILTPVDVLDENKIPPDENSILRLNMLYAKEYRAGNDLRIMWKGRRKLGK